MMRSIIYPLTFLLAATVAPAAPTLPKGAIDLESSSLPASFRLHVEFSTDAGGEVRIGEKFSSPLAGKSCDLAVERPADGQPLVRVWTNGKLTQEAKEAPELALGKPDEKAAETVSQAKVNMGGDFTAYTQFTTTGDGTLLSKCAPKGKWVPGAKAFFIRGGKLVYDIGFLGEMSTELRVDDGKQHTAVLTVSGGNATIWLDGDDTEPKRNFTKPDVDKHVLKIGRAAPDFGGDFKGGTIHNVRFWQRALPEGEIKSLFKNEAKGANTPDFTWSPPADPNRPIITPKSGTKVTSAWIQPLENVDHAALVRGWNEKSLKEGEQIYTTLCIVCHGTKETPGTLPTALRFAEAPFKNGSDPLSLYTTLTSGFNQMVPQNQYTTEQKYSVIQYIRETFLKPHNPTQLTKVDEDFLAMLPLGKVKAAAEVKDTRAPEYKRMEFGPVLMWTLQVAPGNVAQKAICIRLDDGPGGVSKGRAWMTYDHDTMSLAAATTGEFVDWKGIAFDGSHGSHTSLAGTPHIINPVGPGWADAAGTWKEDRVLGRDNKPYGPLPQAWAKYEGLYINGSKVVIATRIHGAQVLESPGLVEYGTTPVFIRTLNIGKSEKPLLLRLAPESVSAVLTGPGKLTKQDGFWVAELQPNSKVQLALSKMDQPSLDAMAKSYKGALDLEPLTHGGPARWEEKVATSIKAGPAGTISADDLALPVDNPWQAWMRPGGFDLFPDGKSAILATWNGDVWKVDGIADKPDSFLTWKRIAAGLFQPLGVKIYKGEIYVTCRDQLVRLKDLNGDGEADFYECFNNDQQVTEHFHEFAMGLQMDDAGNFYYAKSARHALPAVVPHHGTLLRVSTDGSKTDIIANGFRAANGVCLNPDGSFFVTDQEGHWTPKNRINRVKQGGFYGNLFGYTNVTDPADSAMEQPMVWITNNMDRSPAELLWIPKDKWGPLGGSLLNLSYGTGKIFIVPHEEVSGSWQGAVCELPLPAFPSGIMRGRFAPDGTLFASGMFAWAGNATHPGGFHRIAPPTKPLYVPIGIHAKTAKLEVVLSDAIDPASAKKDAATLSVWALKRSANYGSNHVDEHKLEISDIKVSPDGKTIELDVPDLQPTYCYALTLDLRAPDGTPVKRVLHGTIHKLAEK